VNKSLVLQAWVRAYSGTYFYIDHPTVCLFLMLEIPLKFENCFQWNHGSSASVYEAWVILAGAMHGQFCKLRREEISNTHLNMPWCKIKKTLYCLNGKIMEVNGGGSSTPCFKKLEAIYLPN